MNSNNSQSNSHPFSFSTRGDVPRAPQVSWPPRAYGGPSSGLGYCRGPSTNSVSASFNPVYTTNPVETFAINQAVQVFYEGTWVAGIIVAGLHRVDAYNRLGYTVNFLAGRRRYVEGEFFQEHVKVAPAPRECT